MYSIAKNVKIVIALLKAHNITKLVLNPGGTNAAFVRGVQDDSFFECYSIVDERSALYFAIGLYLECGQPIALCCTSAQATRNYIPGLTEAYYKHAPILAITFSKHPHYTYQEYMQAPDQTSLPNDAVKKTFALPYVSNRHDALLCARMVNEAMLELTYKCKAPIQINVPMLDTELLKDESNELPNVKVIKRYYNNACLNDVGDKKILIVIGENRGIFGESLSSFSEKFNSAIYVNHLSNYRCCNTVHANLLLSSITQEDFDRGFCPDILITIGGQTGDYPLFTKLSNSYKDYEHWRISETGDIVDTYDHLTKVFECAHEEFFSISHTVSSSKMYLSCWKEVLEGINLNKQLPFSNIYVAQKLHSILPIDSNIHFAILNSLRSWNLFPIENNIKCFSNVAAFGIDGCMSTFIGQSILSKELCYLVIGDLAFFYDMNSLGIKYIKNNVKILLINNNGGIEFKLGGDQEANKKIDNYIAAAGHFKSAEGWATTNNFTYKSIRNQSQFEENIKLLIDKTEKPVIFELFTNDLDESVAYKTMVGLNNATSLTRRLFNKINSILK